ncbi:MAG: hypothetical protein HYV04_14170 [Deltaproteobacteria bacterium]|nr:hypothetical protein [Deltaproteobacteria bacterium]
MTESFPKYSFGIWVAGVVNMSNQGVVFLALVCGILGLLLVYWFPRLGGLLLVGSAFTLIVQVVSRVRYISKLQTIRPVPGGVEIFHWPSKRWLPGTLITTIAKEDFAYADPWRPITIGHPGIDITFQDVPEPAQVLFPYWLEWHRDQVFDYLARLFPDKIDRDSAKENGR